MGRKIKHMEGRKLTGRLEILHGRGFELTLNHDERTFRVVFAKKCSHATHTKADVLIERFVAKGYDNLS